MYGCLHNSWLADGGTHTEGGGHNVRIPLEDKEIKECIKKEKKTILGFNGTLNTSGGVLTGN